jgi:hypothetical protein
VGEFNQPGSRAQFAKELPMPASWAFSGAGKLIPRLATAEAPKLSETTKGWRAEKDKTGDGMHGSVGE